MAVPARDWDLAKYNDCLGSVSVDLTKPLQRAFRTKRTVSLFKAAPASSPPPAPEGAKGGGDAAAGKDVQGQGASAA